MNADLVVIRWLGRCDYQPIWQAMQRYTHGRTLETTDEIWLLEHNPVFTQGQNGKAEHVLNPGAIPIIHTDRGGQVTYHGPGQLMVYTLVDLRRKKLNIREYVTLLEQVIITLLQQFNVSAYAKAKAPGVYVKNSLGQEAKICSIGLRIRKGCSYHGLAFNIKMALAPFNRINPCGFSHLRMAQLADFIPDVEILSVAKKLANQLVKKLVYTHSLWLEESLKQASADNNKRPSNG